MPSPYGESATREIERGRVLRQREIANKQLWSGVSYAKHVSRVRRAEKAFGRVLILLAVALIERPLC